MSSLTPNENDQKGYSILNRSFTDAYFVLPNSTGSSDFLDLRSGIKITKTPEVRYDYDNTTQILTASANNNTYAVSPESITRHANTNNIAGYALGFRMHASGSHFLIHNRKGEVCHYYSAYNKINSFFSEYNQYGSKYPVLRIVLLKMQ